MLEGSNTMNIICTIKFAELCMYTIKSLVGAVNIATKVLCFISYSFDVSDNNISIRTRATFFKTCAIVQFLKSYFHSVEKETIAHSVVDI